MMTVHVLSSSIVVLSLIGLGISLYIFTTKARHATKAMVCPIGTDCSAVVSSRYGKTFGIENSLLGMLYYLGIGIYFFLFFFEVFLPAEQLIRLLVKVGTAGSFLFSLYLLGVMKFRLKEWCSWCVASAVISTGIFILTLFT